MAIEVAWYKVLVCVLYITASQPTIGENNQENMGPAESLEVDAITLKLGEHYFLLFHLKESLQKSYYNLHISIPIQSNRNFVAQELVPIHLVLYYNI